MAGFGTRTAGFLATLRRGLVASAAALLVVGSAAAAITALSTSAASATTYTHHNRPHFLSAADFTGNASIFPLHVPVAQNNDISSLSTSSSGQVSGGKPLPSLTPQAIPAATAATATTFDVNTTADTDLATPTSTSCADANGNCSLRAAAEAATNLGDQSPPVPVVIDLQAGTTYTLSNTDNDQGTNGELYLEDPAGITINGGGAGSTIITITQSGGVGIDRVLGIGEEEETSGTPVVINGVTITGGFTEADDDDPGVTPAADDPSTYDQGCGGGIDEGQSNDVLELNGVSVTGNGAGASDYDSAGGGGLCVNGTLYASGSTISQNDVTPTGSDQEDFGGGMVVGWDDYAAAILSDDTISGNTVNTSAEDTSECCGFAAGGGITAIYGSTMSITGTTISSNTVTSGSDDCAASDEDDYCQYLGGGGLFTEYAAVNLSDSTISSNSVTDSQQSDDYVGALGGGILNDGGLTLDDDQVTGNSAATGGGTSTSMNSAEGGGIAAYAAMTVGGSTIDDNTVVGTANADDENCEISGGGGIYAAVDGLTVTGTSISDNSVSQGSGGGVVLAFSEEEDEEVVAPGLEDVGSSQGAVFAGDQIDGNSSTTTYSYADNPDPYYFGSVGGLFGDEVDTVQISQSTVDGNTADTWGGGVWIDDMNGLISASTVAGNSAYLGGGLLETDGAQVSTSNSTISDNTATGTATYDFGDDVFQAGGGGAYVSEDSQLQLSYDTLAGNTAASGAAGVMSFADGSGTSVGTIIAGNTVNGTETDCLDADGATDHTLTSGGYNLVGDSSCGFGTATDIVGEGANLQPLADNGGPTPTMLPTEGSPEIGAGGLPPTCPATDQRGVTRPQGSACTIGAVEVPTGYWMSGADGGVFALGNAPFFGSLVNLPGRSSSPTVGIVTMPTAHGYWLVQANGTVSNFGKARNFGSISSRTLNKPIVAMAPTPDSGGYWLAGGDGGVFAYGDAPFYGSMVGRHLNADVVGMAATPDGGGYWLVGADGGVFAFGDAAFYGSMGGQPLNQPIVGIAATPEGGGYWLVASDGGIFAFGDAAFYGSTGGMTLNEPIVGMAPTGDGGGYWLVASDGGIFAFGDAPFMGSLPGLGVSVDDVTGLAAP